MREILRASTDHDSFKNIQNFKRLKSFQSFQLFKRTFPFKKTSVIAGLSLPESVEISGRLDDIDPGIDQFDLAGWSQDLQNIREHGPRHF
ncbi:hypothetical protein [Neorhizobium sp. NCHU2750]|uniref:hypothetical protein n=1 Tax=Neorhizobium sp. NCHU2750 TaxID=1825976 RepID=UPI000E73FBEA